MTAAPKSILLRVIGGVLILLFVLYASLSALVNQGFDIVSALIFLLLVGIGVAGLFLLVKR